MRESTKKIIEDFCKRENLDPTCEQHSVFYNEKSVNRGRSDKICSICGDIIPIGEPHFVETDCECSFPMHKMCRDIALQLYDKYNPECAEGGGIEDFFSTEEISELIEQLEEEVYESEENS